MRPPGRTGVTTKVAAVVVIVVLLAGGAAVYLYESSQGPKSNLTFSLGISPGPEDAPQYYALKQGYYSGLGLNVTILPGTGGAAAIASVSSGEVDFALTDASGLVYSLLSSNVTNVKIVAVIFPTSFFGIIYNKAMISNIADLSGAPGAALNPSIGISTKLFLGLAKQNNLNVSNVQYSTSESTVEGEVSTGKVDWAIGGAQDVAFLQPVDAQKVIQLVFFPYRELVFTSYGEVLITSTSMIAQNPDLVKSFVSATLKGMVQGTLNPLAAAEAEASYQPQLNVSQMQAGFDLDVNCCLTGVTSSTNPLVFGYINSTRMQQTANNVIAGAGLDRQVDATQFYTDAFTQAP